MLAVLHVASCCSAVVAIAHTSVSYLLNTTYAAEWTGHYVCQLLEPALTTVPLAADVTSLFQSAL